MHSAPILMIASSDLAPQVFWTHLTGKGKYTDAQLRICGMIHDLDCAVVLQSRLDMLKNWKDIVRSVQNLFILMTKTENVQDLHNRKTIILIVYANI